MKNKYPIGTKLKFDEETKNRLLFLKKAVEWVNFIPEQLTEGDNPQEKIKEITKTNPAATMFSYSAGGGWNTEFSVIQAQISQKTLIALMWSIAFESLKIDHDCWKILKINFSEDMDHFEVIGYHDDSTIPDFVPQEWMQEFKDV